VFVLPSIEMLAPGKLEIGPMFDEEKLRKNAELLIKTLADYKITGKVEEILPGPVVTTYEVSPVAGTKVSKVAALADDLALALAKKVARRADPGKPYRLELPNEKRAGHLPRPRRGSKAPDARRPAPRRLARYRRQSGHADPRACSRDRRRRDGRRQERRLNVMPRRLYRRTPEDCAC
jgi:DNA segregation ATPase FtsK/SpoIIIE-like protein